MPKRVGLTVDWDYFTEIPLPDSGNSWAFDWGMSERDDPLFGSTIWMIRYASLIQHGLLDQIKLYYMVQGFWDRFTFAPKTSAVVTESHTAAYQWALDNELDEIWSFDAHHDFGYRDQWADAHHDVACDNWAFWLAVRKRITTHVRYPGWKPFAMLYDGHPDHGDVLRYLDRAMTNSADDGEDYPEFCAVHVCKSSPWTPPWLDLHFELFMADLRMPRTVREFPNPIYPRPFSTREGQQLAEQLIRQQADLQRQMEAKIA